MTAPPLSAAPVFGTSPHNAFSTVPASSAFEPAPSRAISVHTRQNLDIDLPPWFSSFVSQLAGALALRPGWDGRQAPAVQPAAATTAVRTIADLITTTSPGPRVVPTAIGGIQLEWYRPGYEIEIEVAPDGTSAEVYVLDAETDEDVVSTFAEALPRLLELLQNEHDK
jgi:hypothetical protein